MVRKIPGKSKDFQEGSALPKINDNGVTVYSMRFCPYAERVRLMLNTKHVPYEVINIDLKSKPEWFLERNPLGKVPAIEEPGKKPLFESLVVAEYIDEQFKGNREVLPSDPYEKARQKVIAQNITTPFYGVLFKNESGDAILKGLEDVEKMLTSEYFAGSSQGFVDLMVWPWFERLASLADARPGALQIDFSCYPKIKLWMERKLNDPDVKDTAYSQETFTTFLKARWRGNRTRTLVFDSTEDLAQGF
ncbi:hypothetical protein RvY_04767 [Ramazzottius varieornatus]|uniref:Glutathione S-transferase omega n=1 Tax=Ramazzottius varieornatus TaxID=947166 RepID=A0A1D1UW08_RAMVA|nr:hypothetical protein RvY_04767 [Ramazzottius varieornatus]